MSEKILIINNKDEEKFLRKPTQDLEFGANKEWSHGGKTMSRQEWNNLITRMRKIMLAANGIGLSANQIGLSYNLFVAQVPSPEGGSKFYSVVNPKLEKISKESWSMDEGCLSVPELSGEVIRPEKVTLSGYDKNGKPLKIKAWGLLARVFQHEVDHLNGKLFIDRTKSVRNTSSLTINE